MGHPPPGMTIERMDNNGDYSPKNCQWASRAEQSRNTRRSKYIAYRGQRMCVADWATRLGICWGTLYWRLKKWPIGRALTTPPRRW
jgi:hypothetical protein